MVHNAHASLDNGEEVGSHLDTELGSKVYQFFRAIISISKSKPNLEFENNIIGQAIPSNFIQHIEKGLGKLPIRKYLFYFLFIMVI